ncbi:extracellular solute-binding protein [Bradyrhizobium sp. BEA-2-5]|uniref:extracellular solute-binding protein n=1 Tax=Bradyrhizobium sp. BEA-2-5 TaxID=3080015 RepID=UPI00293EA8FC|nr:extracellular solute-binding protein [Bradyrhizobium sp. BEA-2-5]WOH80296.1 extracellular solute-binding protein [Bradyrhizobium sp. BEA-2-5]
MFELTRRYLLAGSSSLLLTMEPREGAMSAPVQTIKIKVAAAPSIYQQAFASVIEAFKQQNPSVVVELIPAVREDEELVQLTLRSAIVGDVPDVLFISPNLMRLLVDRKLAVPLETVGATAPSLQSLGLIPGAEGMGQVAGRLYGTPMGVSTPVIAYNAELVRKAGADPDNFPTSWQEATSLISRIHQLDRGIIGGFFEYDNTGNWTYKALVATLGGRMMSADDKVIMFDDPKGLEALRILRGFAEAGQGAVDMTRDQARQAFSAGRIGVLVTSSGALPGLERQANGVFTLKAAPFPLGSENGKVPAAGTVAMILAKDDGKRRAAWQLMQFVLGVEAQTIIGRATGLVSINRQALEDPNRLGSHMKARPNQRAAVMQLSRLTEWYAFPGDNAIRITDTIKRHLQAVLTLKRTPEEALASMRAEVSALLGT